MKIQIRLTRATYDKVRKDLERPHHFAGERVGFLKAKMGNRDGDPLLVLLTEYEAVPDDQYVFDPKAGARINSTAIRNAMQGILDSGLGAFHVHMHPHSGRPSLSPLDHRELPKLISSFRAVGPNTAHGIFLMSYDHCVGFVWIPGVQQATQSSKVSIVGFPMELLA
jgi:hypothetical protein